MKSRPQDKNVSAEGKTVATGTDRTLLVGGRLQIARKVLRALKTTVTESSLVLATDSSHPEPRSVGEKLVVGRGAAAGWTIDDGTLSRLHFEVVATPTGCLLRDLQSHNGTRVNDAPCSERWLADGDIIRAGKQLFLFLARLEDQAV